MDLVAHLGMPTTPACSSVMVTSDLLLPENHAHVPAAALEAKEAGEHVRDCALRQATAREQVVEGRYRDVHLLDPEPVPLGYPANLTPRVGFRASALLMVVHNVGERAPR